MFFKAVLTNHWTIVREVKTFFPKILIRLISLLPIVASPFLYAAKTKIKNIVFM